MKKQFAINRILRLNARCTKINLIVAHSRKRIIRNFSIGGKVLHVQSKAFCFVALCVHKQLSIRRAAGAESNAKIISIQLCKRLSAHFGSLDGRRLK
ncbi:hypothetical protein DSECCO2_393040 [anaerobic digester metagenome]